jgi:ectoine hydroxylase-related dioxygenase (phytanoyl-CoA dioxygenase family)
MTATATETLTAKLPEIDMMGGNVDLDASKRYGVSISRGREDYDRAVEIITSRLSDMTPIEGKLLVNLGTEYPELLIDARTSPPTLKTASSDDSKDKDTHIILTPQMVKRLYDGNLDSRYALSLGFVRVLEGSRRHCLKFGDALTGFHVTHPKLDSAIIPNLPKPTEDYAQVRRDLHKWGYGFVKNALSPDELNRLRARVSEQCKAEEKAGVAYFDGGINKPNQRLGCLPNKGQEFIDLLDKNTVIDEMVPDFLGDGAILFSYTANIARPGSVPMSLHTDQITIQPPIRSVAVGMNLMYFLEDVTPENGGTLVMPGSHRGQVAPDDTDNHVDCVSASGPAGTCMVFESRLWHATGANTTKDVERPVILIFFSRPWMRQQENFALSIKEDVLERCSDRVKGFMGFRVTGSLGSVQNPFGAADGSIVRRPREDEYVGELKL